MKMNRAQGSPATAEPTWTESPPFSWMWLSTIQMREEPSFGATPWMSTSVVLRGSPLWWMWFA